MVFSYRKHAGNISADQEQRLLENIRVIEKLLQDYPKAEQLLGKRRIDKRLAYRYYRLAKTRLKHGKGLEARAALNAGGSFVAIQSEISRISIAMAYIDGARLNYGFQHHHCEF